MTKQVQRSFERAVTTYQQEALIQKEVARECALLVPEGVYSRVLEIGAGGGFLTSECLSRINAGIYVAMDFSRAMLEPLSRKKSVFLLGDGRQQPFKEASFDLLVSSSTMQWYGKGPEALARNLALLNDEGRFSISLFVAGTFSQMAHISSLSGFGSLYPLPEAEQYLKSMSEGHFGFKSRLKEYTRYFPSVPEFLKSHKKTGATYTAKEFRFGKKSYARFCRLYRDIYARKGMIPVSYHVLYIWGRKK